MRGLYEAGGDTSAGYPTLKTTSLNLARDVQSLLLALGCPAKLDVAQKPSGWGKLPVASLRLLNLSWNEQWCADIGFMGDRSRAGVQLSDAQQAGRKDYIPVSRELVDRLAPTNDRLRRVLLMEQARGRVSRRIAAELYAQTGDGELGHLLGFFYDTVSAAELGEEELTYDVSVPANVTYIANGFVSHNTIGLMMDCDTTGIEPDLGLVKTKKLVGGGTMSIVNQTVPRALRRLGYSEDQVVDITAYVDEQKSIIGAPYLSPDHLAVFACSMGDNTIHYRGHVKMMSAAQPFLSGAISKTVNMPEDVTVEDVEQLHIEAWQLGIKAVAIYRDNCKVGQPLATTKKTVPPTAASASEAEAHDAELAAKVAELEKALAQRQAPVGAQAGPRAHASQAQVVHLLFPGGRLRRLRDGRRVRRRPPRRGLHKVSKQGSTLAGIMDAFAISVSLGLQHGVPLATFVRHFTNMRFEPAGMTDDPELRFAASLVDYIFRRLAVEYMNPAERTDAGILTVSERLQPTLPGVEEAATVNRADPARRPVRARSNCARACRPEHDPRPDRPRRSQGQGRRTLGGGRRQEAQDRPPATPPIATSAGCRCSGPAPVSPAPRAGRPAVARDVM